MVDKAAGNKEDTLRMLMRRSRTKALVRTVADRFRKRGYQFRDLHEKPCVISSLKFIRINLKYGS